jgi:RNA polymerase sigma factor (sigma-70 family)
MTETFQNAGLAQGFLPSPVGFLRSLTTGSHGPAAPCAPPCFSFMDNLSQEIPADLIARAIQGEAQAGREIVEALHPMVGRLVRGQIRRHADVEDVVQEVFLKIFVKMHQYHGPQPFEHWASRLSITTCYDWLRRQKARPAVMASDLTDAEREAIERSLADDPGEDSNARAELLTGLLDRLLASLKPQEQVVIRLLDIEERPVAEVAELTGWGHSKIKVTAFRARKKLGELLQRLEKP